MVYVISSQNKHYKIGVAKSPIRRLRELQTAHPFRLAIAAVADWPNSAERRIHSILRPYRLRGEWFRACDELTELITAIQSGASFNEWVLSRPDAPRRLHHVISMTARP